MKKQRLSYLLTATAVIAGASLLVKCSKSEVPAQAASSNANVALPGSFNSYHITGTFVHPGVINTKATLDFIATEANDNTTARYNDYNNTVLDYCNSHAVPTTWVSTVHVAGGTTTPDEKRFKGDGLLAGALILPTSPTIRVQILARLTLRLHGPRQILWLLPRSSNGMCRLMVLAVGGPVPKMPTLQPLSIS
jgi:hypothetical protein